MNFSRTVRILAAALLLVLATTAQTASAQDNLPPRTVMWLHGRGEEGQGYWNRFASDILNNRGRIDTLNYFDDRAIQRTYTTQFAGITNTFGGAVLPGGYWSDYSISETASQAYFRLSTVGSLSSAQASSAVLIGHSQGGIVARELDRLIASGNPITQPDSYIRFNPATFSFDPIRPNLVASNPLPIGGIITVGSPNSGVGLLRARSKTTTVGGVVKDEIGLALDAAMPKIVLPAIYDPIYGFSALGALGGEFLSREVCNRSGVENLGTGIQSAIDFLIFGGVGLAAGITKKAVDVGFYIMRLWVRVASGGTLTTPPPEEMLFWGLPSIIATGAYAGMAQSFLGASDPTKTLETSVEQMAPAGISQLPKSLIGTLNTPNLTNTPRAGIYGSARFVSPVRLLSNQLGRARNFSQTSSVTSQSLDFFLCGVEPGGAIFPLFAKALPEKQTFREPDDARLLQYYNRLRNIYATGYDINQGFGYLTLALQGLIKLIDFMPTSFDVANRWADGRNFFDTEFQNTYAYLNGASRVVNTTQRITKVGYRCPGSRGLSPTPQGADCVMEITEVDEPVSYIVSTGDDGFIAENDQKIPLRDAVVRHPLERNYRAGENSSCNHFTEGNHPEVHRALRLMLAEDITSPFYIPR